MDRVEMGKRNEEPAYANDSMSQRGQSSAPRAHGGSVERSLEWAGSWGGGRPLFLSVSLCHSGGFRAEVVGGPIIGA